jgi:hypothetical protein
MNPLLINRPRRPIVKMQVGGDSLAGYGLLGGLGYALWKHRWGWALASAAGFIGLGFAELAEFDYQLNQALQYPTAIPPAYIGTIPPSTALPAGTKNRAPGATVTTQTTNAQVLGDFPQYSLVTLADGVTVVAVQIDGSGIPQPGTTL